jgi:cold shock CspA family protein
MSTTQETVSNEISVNKVVGQVKWFNIKAGYGFITLSEGEHIGKDIFVHYSSLNVVNSQYRYLVQGEYVEFNLVKLEGDKYEYHAVDVRGIKGGPIMCETRRIALESRPEGEPRQRNSRNQSSRPREPREPREQRDEPHERKVVRRSSVREEAAPSSSEEPGFEKVVKKRQPRTKNV